jgi:hypothetical protein
VDSSPKGNVYLSKKVRRGSPVRLLHEVELMGLGTLLHHQAIKGETRLAITTHESADVGVCVKNTLDFCALKARGCQARLGKNESLITAVKCYQ